MLDRIPWICVEVTIGLAACVAVGAAVGMAVVLVLPEKGERR